ncbi:MAG TPA: hypothetical protein VG605_23665 [Puia sp.]|nr:hypothetical protein [Puia sp.]
MTTKPSPVPVLRWFVLFLSAIFLLNILTPLRLHVDMLRYFAIKDCVELGCPPDSAAAKDYMPWGYTALLLFLSKIGLLKSWVLVLINCGYFFGALYLIRKMLPATLNPMVFMVLVLLNWTAIKFVAHPLSEMQYLFFSVCSLYCFYRYAANRNLLVLIAAFAFGALAFITRTVGVALAAALVVGLAVLYKKELLKLVRKNKLLVGALIVLLLGVVIFSKQLGLNHYTGVFNKQFVEGVTFSKILKWHFTEWSEIVFNVSLAKLLPFLSPGVAGALFLVAGILIFAGFAWIFWICKNDLPFIIKLYFFFYSVVMFTWPFYDPRFWVPVLPLIAVAGAQLWARKVARGILYPVFAVYAFLGLASVGFFTYTSLNREVFARSQANGVYRNEYETFFFGRPQSDTARVVDPVILNVIKRYDR